MRWMAASDRATQTGTLGWAGGTYTAEQVLQQCITRLPVRDGDVMIDSGFRTIHNMSATSLHQGRQRITRFNIIVEAFSKPDRSWFGCEQEQQGRN